MQIIFHMVIMFDNKLPLLNTVLRPFDGFYLPKRIAQGEKLLDVKHSHWQLQFILMIKGCC